MDEVTQRHHAAFVRATYEPGRWVVVVVRSHGGRAGSTATVFDVGGDLRVPAPALWDAISTEATRRGVRLPDPPVALVVASTPGVREWRPRPA